MQNSQTFRDIYNKNIQPTKHTIKWNDLKVKANPNQVCASFDCIIITLKKTHRIYKNTGNIKTASLKYMYFQYENYQHGRNNAELYLFYG